MSDPEQIIRDQLAAHGDGAQALTAAEQATGMPRPHLEHVLHALMSGKGGQPIPRIGGTGSATRLAMLERCRLCGAHVAKLALHHRRRHPEAK